MSFHLYVPSIWPLPSFHMDTFEKWHYQWWYKSLQCMSFWSMFSQLDKCSYIYAAQQIYVMYLSSKWPLSLSCTFNISISHWTTRCCNMCISYESTAISYICYNYFSVPPALSQTYICTFYIMFKWNILTWKHGFIVETYHI